MSHLNDAVDRAYSLLQIKSVDDDQRIIEGIASTPELDRGGDIMDPFGAKYRLPLTLLWMHQKDKPIGQVFALTPRADGIHIKASIARGVLPFIEEAWALIKSGLARGLSIDWLPLAPPTAHGGGRKYSHWEFVGLSAVTIPMNARATISLVKSLDAQALAASGNRSSIPSTPGASGLFPRTAMNQTPVSEQITALQAQLQQKSARLEELMAASDAEGGIESAEETELDGLEPEIQSLTKKLGRLSAIESAQLAQSRTVTTTPPQGTFSQQPTKTQPRVEVKELPKGTLFTRYAMAVAAGKGSYSDTLAYAKQFSGTPVVAEMVKHFRTKAVEGTSVVASPGWGGELVNPNTAMTEFVELLMPETIIGKVQGFDRVPFNIPIITQTGGSTFEWVDEGAPKPVGELAFKRDTMGHAKAAGIIVMTEELVRLSTPSAEARSRQDMINQCRKFLDERFIRVAHAAGTENPASITNAVTSPAASGTDVESLKADLVTAFGTFTTAGLSLSGLVIVMSSTNALGISLLTNQLGQTPTGFAVTPMGGTLLGYQVIVSDSVDAGTIVIFKPSEIFLADDGEVRIDASNQATLDMTGGATATFNLWQRNCVGLRAERWINWKKKRADVVAVIDTAAYGPTVGS